MSGLAELPSDSWFFERLVSDQEAVTQFCWSSDRCSAKALGNLPGYVWLLTELS